MLSIYGSSGFIGKNFIEKYKECIIIPRDQNTPESENILYFISTIDNYNIYSDPFLDINTNIVKLIHVLEKCKEINQTKKITFNFISSWFVYGKTTDLPASEETFCNPTGFYSISKRTAEQLLISYCETYDINYRILRLTNIIGKSDNKVSKKKNAIQYMINLLKSDEDVFLYDNGDNIRDYMHVDDACRAIKCVIDNGPMNQITNISNSEPKKIKEIIFYAKEKLNSNSNIKSIETPKFHNIVQIKDMWLKNDKLISYGYIPEISVNEAIDKIL